MRTLLNEHKYKTLVVILLLSASLISSALVSTRIQNSDSYRYVFLLWNLILAWVPLIFAALANFFHRRNAGILVIISGFIWLAFFPNAPYILTDFQHISVVEASVPVWYDVIMVAWFMWTGMTLGVVSLYLMHDVVTRTFNVVAGWLFVTGVIALSSFGVYLGRFLRWNSWDVVNQPAVLAQDILDRIIHPLAHPRTLAFTWPFTALFFFIYLITYIFGHLHREQQPA